MDASLFAFTWDLLDPGEEPTLDVISKGGWVRGVTVAACYHASRDIFPHNPRRRMRYLVPGACYFRPDPARYRGLALQPGPTEVPDGPDPFDVLRSATATRGMALNAWVVFLHDAATAERRADYVQRNLFGEPQLTDLCPANPAVAEYVRALAGDAGRLGCDSLVAESLHFHGLRHGYHHERYLFPLGELAEQLLGICFCRHCEARARQAGVDVPAVRRVSHDVVADAFAGHRADDTDEATWARLQRLADGELAAYLQVGGNTVTSLVGAVREALAGTGTRLTVIDPTGSAKGYATGLPTGALCADSGWRFGVDPTLISAIVDGYQVLAYARDVQRVDSELGAYRAKLTAETGLRVVLRPGPPDCPDTDNLAAKIATVRAAGAAGVDFYHFGLMPLAALDRVQTALARATAQRPG